jgi:hypothetical protein
MRYAVLQNRDRSWSTIRAGVDGNLWKKGVNSFRSPQNHSDKITLEIAVSLNVHAVNLKIFVTSCTYNIIKLTI